MNDEINNKLKQISTENYIWLIYLGIIFFSWIANNYEKRYFIYKDIELRKKYQRLMIIIFSILIIIYLYFFKSSIEDIKNLKPYDSEKKKRLVYLSFLGSLFIVLSGIIFLYIAINDEELEIEIAFN